MMKRTITQFLVSPLAVLVYGIFGLSGARLLYAHHLKVLLSAELTDPLYTITAVLLLLGGFAAIVGLLAIKPRLERSGILFLVGGIGIYVGTLFTVAVLITDTKAWIDIGIAIVMLVRYWMLGHALKTAERI
jgi:hypothetical protein